MRRISTYGIALVGSALVLFSCSSRRLTREGVRKEFEKDSGFKLPSSARHVEGVFSSADFHGDYSMAVTFIVPLDELGTFSTLPASAWLHPDDWKPLTAARDISREINSLPADPTYQVPAGTLYIDQWGTDDSHRKFAVNPVSGRVIFARETW